MNKAKSVGVLQRAPPQVLTREGERGVLRRAPRRALTREGERGALTSCCLQLHLLMRNPQEPKAILKLPRTTTSCLHCPSREYTQPSMLETTARIMSRVRFGGRSRPEISGTWSEKSI